MVQQHPAPSRSLTVTIKWACGNRLCSHRFSRAWHADMSRRIERSAGPRMLEDFERAHPDPDMAECDDCGMVGGHNLGIEH